MLGGSDPNFVPMSDEECLNRLPPGYYFQPTHEELIVDYLLKKVKGKPLPPNRIRDIKVYDFLPGYLFETYNPKKENQVYFFTVREKKHDNGEGYWRASREKPIFSGATGRKVGYWRSLVYHEFGTSEGGVKTPWRMHEYRIGDNLDEWVICKLYKQPNMEVRAPKPTDDVPNEADTGATPAPKPTDDVPNEADTGAIPSPKPTDDVPNEADTGAIPSSLPSSEVVL